MPSLGGTWPPSAVPDPKAFVDDELPNPLPPNGEDVVLLVAAAPKPGLFPVKRLLPVLLLPNPPLELFDPKLPKAVPPDGAELVVVLFPNSPPPLLAPNPVLFPPNREFPPEVLFDPKPPEIN